MQKRLKLKKAFGLLAETVEGDNGTKTVSLEKWLQISKFVLPKTDDEFVKLLFHILATAHENRLELNEFLYVSDLLNIDIRKKEPSGHIFEKLLPNFYYNQISTKTRQLVRNPFFTYAFDLLIIANAVILAVCSKEVVSATEWAFLVFFTGEILLKLYTVGPMAFITKGWNIFDLTLVLLAWAAAIAENASPNVAEFEIFYDMVITVRVLRVFRIIYSIQQFVVIVNTFHHILPSVAAIVTLLLVSQSPTFAPT